MIITEQDCKPPDLFKYDLDPGENHLNSLLSWYYFVTIYWAFWIHCHSMLVHTWKDTNSHTWCGLISWGFWFSWIGRIFGFLVVASWYMYFEWLPKWQVMKVVLLEILWMRLSFCWENIRTLLFSISAWKLMEEVKKLDYYNILDAFVAVGKVSCLVQPSFLHLEITWMER